MKQRAEVIIPENLASLPEKHEIEIAWILARHYKFVVEFLKPTDSYKSKTPDVVMDGVMWEFKSPLGSSRKHTVQYQLRIALRQSRNIVLDGRRTKLDDGFIINQLRLEIRRHNRIKSVLFITKSNKIIEF